MALVSIKEGKERLELSPPPPPPPRGLHGLFWGELYILMAFTVHVEVLVRDFLWNVRLQYFAVIPEWTIRTT